MASRTTKVSKDDKVYLVEMLKSDGPKETAPLSKRTIVEIFATPKEAEEWINQNSERYKKYEPDFQDFDIICYYLRHLV